jgi:hypothetical protein
MYQNGVPKKARNWMIRFLLKVNLLILAIVFVFEGIIAANFLIMIIGFLLLPIGIILVRQDIRTDPYYLLQFYKIQFDLWNRLQGPFISRRPYNYHFSEGRSLQQYDVIKVIRVNRKDLLNGKEKIIDIKLPTLCHTCGGKRNKPMTVQIECNNCNQGRHLHFIDKITIPIPCSKCLGLGWTPVHPCRTCKGKGSIWENQRIRVHIPPYTKTGTKLRIPALGKVDVKTQKQGDLYIQVKKSMLDFFY